MEVEDHRLDYRMPLTGGQSADNSIKVPGWIWRFRWWIFGTMLAFYLIAFNGQWRIGRDGALYRGMGHSLATGHGFGYSEFGRRQIYPGLPLLLAGLEKIFGVWALPPILIMHLAALGCLITTYKLVSLRYSRWLAICVTALVGFNGWFMELTNEILTDMPFLLGLLLALYGWERLRIWGVGEKPAGDAAGAIQRAEKRPWISLIILLLGLGLAAIMRPTFWILAIAWVLVCIRGLVAGPRRKFYGICFGVLIVVWLAAFVADPRVKGFNPLGGGYERDAIHSLQRAGATIAKQLPELLSAELSHSFFGEQWGPGLTQAMSLIVLAASLLLWRTNPLWPLLIFLTVMATLMMTTVPRYYTMVLPLLALAWMLLAIEIARRVPVRLADTVLLAAVTLVFVPSVARCVKLIGEQHHLNRDAREGEDPKWKYVTDMGEVVRANVPPGAKVIGPGATIMSYVSDRQVLMWRDLVPDNLPPAEYPQRLAKLGIQYAIFPPNLYHKAERPIRDLMEHGVIVPVRRVARTREMVLAQVKIVKPPGDWTVSPLVDVMTTQGIRTAPTATKPAILRPKPTPEVLARRLQQAERNERHVKATKKLAAFRKARRTQRNPATAPAASTPPITPATQPALP